MPEHTFTPTLRFGTMLPRPIEDDQVAIEEKPSFAPQDMTMPDGANEGFSSDMNLGLSDVINHGLSGGDVHNLGDLGR